MEHPIAGDRRATYPARVLCMPNRQHLSATGKCMKLVYEEAGNL